MPILTWDDTGTHYYECGIRRGVLYPKSGRNYETGVAWNGLIAVTESPSGAEPSSVYSDNIKYSSILSAEEFGVTIEAYAYPDEFRQCIGISDLLLGVEIGQQTRKSFGLCYQTTVGNDISDNYAYKLHLVYGSIAATTEKGYTTISDNQDAIQYSWSVTTVPISVDGCKPSASFCVDSSIIMPRKLKLLENILYGTENSSPSFPSISELINIVTNSLLDSSENQILDSSGNSVFDSQ